MKHFVFGTRPKYDRIVQAFAETIDHTYFPATKRVDQWEESEWIGFDQEQWIKDKNPIVVCGHILTLLAVFKFFLNSIHHQSYPFNV